MKRKAHTYYSCIAHASSSQAMKNVALANASPFFTLQPSVARRALLDDA